MPGQVAVYGIRHHGPGCARSLVAALESLAPDIVLVEGPPDAQAIVPLAADPAMQTPVALLVYAADVPKLAAFYPFATYSPEWQAIQYAMRCAIPVRLIDLPAAALLAEQRQQTDRLPGDMSPDLDAERHTASPSDDPVGALAAAAGFTDRELWWERQIEQRRDSAGLFDGILQAMTALRAESPAPDGVEARREASMRQAIRAAQREGYQRVAVVCGAWHAPAVSTLGPAAQDAALLANLGRLRVLATWVPWTNGRLASRSGYGAGVASPGWYEQLWAGGSSSSSTWLVRAARLLRAEDLPVSSASVIESERLAQTLAALRGSPVPGLDELNDAMFAVMCNGNQAPLALIRHKLEVGDRMGAVPDSVPAVPLQADLAALQRRLRMSPTADTRHLNLDLRTEFDLERSAVLHRLVALGISWGKKLQRSSTTSTFREEWELAWAPELTIAVIEASVWGATVEEAASARMAHTAAGAGLPRLTELLDLATLARLPFAVEALLDAVQQSAALASDTLHLMAAISPLARLARYSDVRQTNAQHILPIIGGLLKRACVGLPLACQFVDDLQADKLATAMEHVHGSIALLEHDDWRVTWQQALRAVMERETDHALVRGWSARLLFDDGVLGAADLSQQAGLALSPAVPADQAGAWLQGALRGSGMRLLQARALWQILDEWLNTLPAGTFVQLLPVLRRAFAGFHAPERQAMAEIVANLGSAGISNTSSSREMTWGDGLDMQRARIVLPVLQRILGVQRNAS